MKIQSQALFPKAHKESVLISWRKEIDGQILFLRLITNSHNHAQQVTNWFIDWLINQA